MSVFLGVGGTGQHTAISYLCLAWLANFKPKPVVIIDNNNQKDDTGLDANGQVVTAPAHLTEMKSWWDDAVIEYIRPYELPAEQREGNSTLAKQYFPAEQEILDLLLGSQNRGGQKAEQEADVTRGFYGMPHVGSIIAHRVVANLGPVQRACENRGPLEARVALSGSIAGGCGAGVIPPVVKTLSAKGLAVQAVLNLLTFVVEEDQEVKDAQTDADKVLVSRLDMESNVASGLLLFCDVLQHDCERVILISLHPEDVYRVRGTNRNQPATAHYTHIAAAALQHLFLSSASPATSTGTSKLRYFNPELDRAFSPKSLVVPPGDVREFTVPFEEDYAQFAKTPVERGKRPAANVLTDFCLDRWLWAAAVQRIIVQWIVDKELDGGRLDGVFDLRDQIRSKRLTDHVKSELRAHSARSRRALAWVRSAFLDNDGKPKPGVETQDAASLSDVLVQEDHKRWTARDRAGRVNRLIDGLPAGVFAEVTTAEVNRWNAQTGGSEVARLIWRRARAFVESEF